MWGLPDGFDATSNQEVGDPRHAAHRALRYASVTIAGVYAALASLWIALSDRLLATLVGDPELLLRVSLYKGFGFVFVTSVLLFVLVRRVTAAIERTFQALDRKDAQRRALAAERERAEVALREAKDRLELTVATRTQELQVALTKAEEADRLKSAFLATMSHELRTPLNSIIGFTGILAHELAGPVNPEQGKQLGMVAKSAAHLLALINDILDLSKIEAGQLPLHRERFAFGDAVQKTTALLHPQAAAKGLRLTAALDPALGEITSDRRRVEQVLLNLIGNAVKFTASGAVEVHAWRSERGVDVAVRDTGPGIPAEAIAQLFQPFSQLDTGINRRHEGTGLGLSICKRLVHALGGAIHVESELGRGSTFSFHLPTHPEASP